MSTPPPPPPPPAPAPRRRRTGLVAAVVLGGAASVTAIALGAYAVWGGGPDSTAATPITSPSEIASADPTTDPVGPPTTTDPVDPVVDYTVTPTQTWQVRAAELMSGDATATIVLASPDPLARPTRQDAVVVSAATSDATSVFGLDRESGEVVWETVISPSAPVRCHALGAGASTVCVTPRSEAGADTYSVATFDSTTGEVQGEDTVDFKPFTVTEVDGDIVLAGHSAAKGALHTTRGTPSDLEARWHATSGDGYVPATEEYGGFTVSDGTGWSSVSGATMIVDLTTGEADSLTGASGQASSPWPGGTVLFSEPQADDVPLTTVTTPGATPFTVEGGAWAHLGASDAMEKVVGIGDAAYDLVTGDQLWSAVTDPSALTTSFLAVDDLVLQQTWWEESVTISAFDALTGAPRWSSGTRSAWLFSRAGDALIADTSYGLEALNLITGERAWDLDYTSLVTGDPYLSAAEHSIAGASLVTTFGTLVTGYTFD